MREKKNRDQLWMPLKSGDVIDIIAPGFKATTEQLQTGVRQLKRWGFQPRFSKDLFGEHFLCSSSDAIRLRQLKKALLAKDSQAIWCLRGGYGSIRLLPLLMKIPKPDKCKLFIGLSDITSLHAFLNGIWGWPSLHGPLLESIGSARIRGRGKNELVNIITGLQPKVIFDQLIPMNNYSRSSKHSCYARIVGGNLTTVQSTLGTEFEIQVKNKILFLEEVAERAYRVDRMLEHLRQVGIFNQASAVIFGDFVGGKESNGRYLWKQVLAEFGRSVRIPVLSGIPSGHGLVQRAVPFMTLSHLKLGGSPQLICDVGYRK